MRRELTAIFLVVVAGLAGCLASTDDEDQCEGDACPTPTSSPEPTLITWPPGVDFPPLPVNASARTFLHEGCMGQGGTLDVPREFMAQALPPGFQPDDGLAGGMTTVYFVLLDCNRLVGAANIFPEYNELLLAANVLVDNSSWVPDDTPLRFVLDMFVSSQEAAEAWRALGVPALQAAFIHETLPVSTGTFDQWRIQTSNAKVELEYGSSGMQAFSGDAPNLLWFGSNPYLRIATSIHYTYGFEELAGVMRLEGETNTLHAIRAPNWEWMGPPLLEEHRASTVEDQLFWGEPP